MSRCLRQNAAKANGSFPPKSDSRRVSVFDPLQTFRPNEMIVRVSALPTIARLSHAAAVIGGLVGFAAQWALFAPGNFSERAGAVFIPFLGEHGIYTSTLIGIAWYVGAGLLLIGMAVTILCWSLSRRDRSNTP